MSERTPAHVLLEPERYELAAAPPYRFDLDRRKFFKFNKQCKWIILHGTKSFPVTNSSKIKYNKSVRNSVQAFIPDNTC